MKRITKLAALLALGARLAGTASAAVQDLPAAPPCGS
jgi:hypothetical protein